MERAITLEGKEYRAKQLGLGAIHYEASPVILRKYAENVKEFLTHFNPSSDSEQQFAEELRRDVSQALRIGLDPVEINRWLYGDGTAYIFWMTIRDNHPDMTLAKCEELLRRITPEEIENMRDAADQARGITVNPSEAAGKPPPNNPSQSTGENSNGS